MATIRGSAGNDTITPSQISGGVTGGVPGAGFDSIIGTLGSDTIDAGGFFNALDYSELAASNAIAVTITGSTAITYASGSVVKAGGGGTDSVANAVQFYATAGADSFIGLATQSFGVVYFEGLGGNDTINGANTNWNGADYSRSPTGVNVNLASGTASDGWGGTDTLTNVLRVRGSAFNDTIVGGSGYDFFGPSKGNDSYDGGGSTNDLTYTAGAAILDAGTSIAITFSGVAAGTIVKSGGQGTDSFTSIRSLQGTDFADTITAIAFAAGQSGYTFLYGHGGNDTINGASNSRFVVSYNSFGPSVGITANLATGTASDGQSGTDTLTNVRGLQGSSFNDSLTGSTSDDVFVATSGNDTYSGNGGNDLLDYSGSTGPDTITFTGNGSGTVTKTINGTTGTDSFSNIQIIQGSNGNDSITGFAGATVDVLLRGMGGNDTINGQGNIRNIADYNAGNSGVTIDFSAGNGSASVTGGGIGTDTLVNVFAVQGSTGNDVFKSGAGSYRFDGGGGFGTLGSTITTGGGDAVDYRGYSSPITLSGVSNGNGTTLYYSGSVAKSNGTDSFSAIRGVFGSTGNDTMTGVANNTGANVFVMRGEAGNDTLNSNGGNNVADYIDSPTGVVVNLQTGIASDGWGGTDTLTGFTRVRGSDAGNDSLTGTSGGDFFWGTRGNDTFVGGGGGGDTVSYNNGLHQNGFNGSINVTFTGVGAGLFGHPNGTVAKSSVAGGAVTDTDTLVGINTVWGTPFGDVMQGLNGVAYAWNGDNLRGNGGNDTIYGYGSFNTRVDYTGATSPVVLDLAISIDGSGRVIGTAQDGQGGTDTLIDVVSVQASSQNDTMYGGATNDRFLLTTGGLHLIDGRGGTNDIHYSGSGNVVIDLVAGTLVKAAGTDTILNFQNAQGGSGDDSVYGTAGTNQLSGASGNNLIDGRGGNDWVFYRYFSGITAPTHGADVDLKDGLSGTATNPWDGTDTLVSIENAVGTQFADTITGAVLAGGARSYIRGDGGNDLLKAPTANTNIFADYSNSLSAVTVNLKLGVTTDDGWFGGTDTLVNIQGVRGSAFADTITGSNGADTLIGGLGNDSLDGGTGRDTAIFADTSTNATWVRNPATGAWTVTSTDGTDTLRNIEFLQFTDRTVLLPSVPHDLDGNGVSDILWRNDSGALVAWKIAALNGIGSDFIAQVDPSWSVAGNVDFTGDGSPDILWRHTNGATVLWTMNGTTQVAGIDFGPVDPSWQIAATVGANGAGDAEILWRKTNGDTVIWTVNNGVHTTDTWLGNIDTSWSIAGTGDFFGKGNADILWRSTNGDTKLWQMSGPNGVASYSLPTIDPSWKVASIADFDGEGHGDILWRNNTSGETVIWLMNGANAVGGAPLDPVDLSWSIAATGDYDGNGSADILWRNNTSGETAIWQMQGSTVIGGGLNGSVPTDWHIVA